MKTMIRIVGIRISLLLASLSACLSGAIIAIVLCEEFQLSWDTIIPVVNIPLWIVLTLGALIALAGMQLVLYFRLRPLWDWIRQGATRPALETVPMQVGRDALNLPFYYSTAIWFVWWVVAIFLALLGGNTVGSFLTILGGLGLLAGFSSAVLGHFLVEWAWRKTVLQIFRTGDLTRTPAFCLSLRIRLFLMFLLSAIPLVLMVTLERSRPAEVLLGSGGLFLALLLTWIASTSVARPLDAIMPHLSSIEMGKFDDDVYIAVTSNDEIGVLSSNFNKMVESVRQRNSEVETIYHISQEISYSLELNATLQSILEEVRNIIPYDGAEICLYDKADNLLHVGAWASSAQVIIDTRGRTYKLGEGYTGWVGENRKSLLIPDVDTHHGHKPTIRQIAEGVFLNGYLGVPLVVKGNKMVGTLELVSTKKSVFNEHSQQILEIIAPQAAIAIDNAEQVMARERELKAQIERLKVEIDDVKRAQQVSDITETAYFKNLKEQAQKLRKAAQEGNEQ